MSKIVEVAEQEVAQTSGTVIQLKSFADIPQPDMYLDAGGLKKYQEWCQELLRAGQLTFHNKNMVEAYAGAFDRVNRANRAGKTDRSATELLGKMLRLLEKLVSNGSIAQPGAKGQGSYDTFGFAKRARQRRHNTD